MIRIILWSVLSAAALTLLGLNSGAVITICVLALIIGAGLTRLFNGRWPQGTLRNIGLLLLGPLAVISVARLLFDNVRFLTPGTGALLMLLLAVLLVRNRWRHWF